MLIDYYHVLVGRWFRLRGVQTTRFEIACVKPAPSWSRDSLQSEWKSLWHYRQLHIIIIIIIIIGFHACPFY